MSGKNSKAGVYVQHPGTISVPKKRRVVLERVDDLDFYAALKRVGELEARGKYCMAADAALEAGNYVRADRQKLYGRAKENYVNALSVLKVELDLDEDIQKTYGSYRSEIGDRDRESRLFGSVFALCDLMIGVGERFGDTEFVDRARAEKASLEFKLKNIDDRLLAEKQAEEQARLEAERQEAEQARLEAELANMLNWLAEPPEE